MSDAERLHREAQHWLDLANSISDAAVSAALKALAAEVAEQAAGLDAKWDAQTSTTEYSA